MTPPSRALGTEVHVALSSGTALAGLAYTHRRRSSESTSFAYDERYLADSRAYALDPALPLLTGLQQSPATLATFGAFADSAPDRWGRNLILRAERRTAREENRTARSFGEFELLLRVRDDLRQGAIRYRVDGEFVSDDVSGVPALTDLPQLLSASDAVAADVEDSQSLALLVRAGSSLGGARPKAHVKDQLGRIAIAKFPSLADDWNVMAWEKTALDLASIAGIAVPESQLLKVAGRDVLIVDRFDRAGEQRIGYISAMTALEATDGDTGSYVDIAAALEERSRNATDDLRQLWRRIAFTILISNTDDHLRNHGFLHMDGDAWSLSPAFDLNPNPDPGPKYLSTAIDGDTAADLRPLLAVAALFRVGADYAVRTLSEVASAVGQWRQVATQHGLTRKNLAAMESAFEHGQMEFARTL